MNARRLTLATVVLLCVLVGALALASVSASALNSYALSSSFGEPGSGAGQLSSPTGVAVNEVTHDVYVADTGNRRVDEFSASGAFVRAWGWGVADGLPQFEVCTVACQAGLSGRGAGQFENPLYVAVDNSGGASAGDVYVAESELVTKFDASGNVVSGWGSGGQLNGSTTPEGAFRRIGGIAVDGSGTLLVSEVYQGVIAFEFAQDGSFTTYFPTEYAFHEPGFAVDTAGDLFGNFESGVLEYAYTSTGITFVGRLISGSGTTLAVDSATHELFVGGSFLGGGEEQVYQYVFPSLGKVSEPDGNPCTAVPLEASHPPLSGGCGATSSFGVEGMRGRGIAVDSTNGTGTVYVTDGGFAKIDVFTMPIIVGDWASDVSSTGATLSAIVNPLRSSTQYTLEYGTSTSYGQSVSGNAGEGLGDVRVGHHVQELSPGTVYHYRVVTHSTSGTVESADRTFTTQPAVGEGESPLPDGRAWELVSPPEKRGALLGWGIADNQGLVQAASDGRGITYQSNEPVGEKVSARSTFNQILSVRSADGWTSQDITLPRINAENNEQVLAVDNGTTPEYQLFSPDLSVSLVVPLGIATPLLSSQATSKTVTYLRDSATGGFTPLRGGAEEGGLLAVTPDLNHVIMTTSAALTPEAITGSGGAENLYEWSSAGQQLALVNILPDREPALEGSELAGKFSPETLANEDALVAERAVSRDGRWVAWVTWVGDHRVANEPLYVRDMVGGRTERVGGASAHFESMSSDGSRVFFMEAGELYMLETADEKQTDLTANHGGDPSAGVKEETVFGASEDGSYVYFVATSVLAPGGVSGAENLYVSHDSGGGSWSTRYIGALSFNDTPESKGWVRATSRISPSGRYLAFMSSQPLTGYDNEDAVTGQRDEEVYLYDAAAARLVCASCDPTGARPFGVLDEAGSGTKLLVDTGTVWPRRRLAGNLPSRLETGKERFMYQSRYLSDSGRLFFDSPDALVPQDTNGLEDPYEFELPGVGSCTSTSATYSATSGGCVSLISSGTASTESAFLDASENGDDVFFLTASRLSPADFDNASDVYVAHVCSAGSPCLQPPVSPPACSSGDACKSAPSPQPELFGAAPSATFSGIGNVLEEAKKSVAKKNVVKRKAKPKHHPKKKKKRKGRKARRSTAGRAIGLSTGGTSLKDGRRSS